MNGIDFSADELWTMTLFLLKPDEYLFTVSEQEDLPFAPRQVWFGF